MFVVIGKLAQEGKIRLAAEDFDIAAGFVVEFAVLLVAEFVAGFAADIDLMKHRSAANQLVADYSENRQTFPENFLALRR